jgi:tubulin-specific chaperone D
VGFSSDELTGAVILKIFDMLAVTIEDYTMDKRGDIGSIVREQSMATMLQIIRTYANSQHRKQTIETTTVTRMIELLLQQLNEKIDRIRLLAGSLLQDYFDRYSGLFDIAQREKLEGVFGQENIRKLIKESESKVDNNLETEVIRMEMRIQETIFSDDIDRNLIYFWNLPHNVFPVTVPLLALPQYSRYILKGLCTSAGGISESVIKFSLQELGNYLTHVHTEKREECLFDLMDQIMALMKDHYK